MEDEHLLISREALRLIVKETVQETLTRIGIEHDDPVEMQRDFTHLRDWRKAVDKARSTSMITAIGILVSGMLGALWLGIQMMVNKGPQ